MFVGGGEDEEALLLEGDHDLGIGGGIALEVVDLALAEDEGLGLDGALLEGDALGHVLDVLHDEVHRDAVVAEARDDDVRVDCGRQDEVAEGLLHELVVLLQHADHAAAALRSVPLEPAAQPDVV